MYLAKKQYYMNIISWNINGLNAIVKKGFFESIKNIDPHILCLQETKASISKTNELLSSLNEYHIFCNSAEKKDIQVLPFLVK